MGHLLNMFLKKSSDAGIATVNWSHGYITTCNTRSWAVKKNGVTIASGNGSTYASGSFTVANGDTIYIESTSGVSGTACNNAEVYIYRDATTVASQTVTGLNATASATWTIATVQATYTMQSGDVI
jgi:co-chaperonin GroES (HSP10)